MPGAFKPNAATPQAIAQIAELLIRHVAHLVKVERETGRTIVLALEPEPCCLLETVEETVAFFGDHLYSRACRRRALPRSPDSTVHEAEDALRRHLGVCLDLCHAAVEFEDPADCLDALAGAGIPIAKIQVTAGLRIPRVTADSVAALQRFDDGVYLHQVVERASGAIAPLRRHRRRLRIGQLAQRRLRMARALPRARVPGGTRRIFLDAGLCSRGAGAAPAAGADAASRGRDLYVVRAAAHAREVPIDEAIARELLWVQRELA